MNDALWRAKRMDMDWIATIDVDEYITLYNGTKLEPNSLNEYFKSLKKVKLYNEMASVEMKSVPFGTNLKIEEQKNRKDLVIDHVYRNNMDVDDEEFHRNKRHWHHKQFLHVKNVFGINTHYFNEHKKVKEFASILRINHYNNPESGLYRASGDLVKDTSLRDSFRNDIITEIQSTAPSRPGRT